jgi:hypothetical protein
LTAIQRCLKSPERDHARPFRLGLAHLERKNITSSTDAALVNKILANAVASTHHPERTSPSERENDGMKICNSWRSKTRNIIQLIVSRPVIPVLMALGAATVSLSENAQAQAQNDHLIVPQERIGPIALGMTANELIHVMGEPMNTKRGPLDRGVDVYNWKNDLSATITKDGLYVTQICTFSPTYATVQGVRTGSTDLSVAALLGQPRNWRVHSAWWGPSYTDLYWPGLMISIHRKGFDTNHMVWKVCVNHFA